MKKLILIIIALLILFSALSIYSQTSNRDTSQSSDDILKQEDQIESLKKELNDVKKDNYEKAMENANKSISLANLMIQLMILAVAIMAGFGIFSYVKTGQIRKKVETEFEEIRKLKEIMKEDLKQEYEKTVNLRFDIEGIRTKAEFLMQEINIKYQSIKKMSEEIEHARKDIDEKKTSVDETKIAITANRLFFEGFMLTLTKRHEEAIMKYMKSVELKPDYMQAWYNIACSYSLLNKKVEALQNLKKAIELDSINKEKAKKDEDFKNLWEDEDFKRLVE